MARDGPESEGTAATDADGRLTGNVACIRCGYNLRTMALDSVCPECGSPVHGSLGVDDLDVRWVRKVWHGLNWVAGAALLLVAVAVADSMAGPLHRETGGVAVVQVLILAGLVASVILWALAAAMVTAGAADQPEEGLTARRVARVGLMAPVPLWVGFALFMEFVLGRPHGGGVMLLVVLLLAVGVVALLLHLARLARRLGRPALASVTLVVMGTLAVAVSGLAAHVLVLENLLRRHVPPGRPYGGLSPYPDWYIFAWLIVMLALFASLPSLAILFVWYWRALAVRLRREPRE